MHHVRVFLKRSAQLFKLPRLPCPLLDAHRFHPWYIGRIKNRNRQNQPNLTESSHAPITVHRPGSNIWADLWFQLKINNGGGGRARPPDSRIEKEGTSSEEKPTSPRQRFSGRGEGREKTVCPNGFWGGARGTSERCRHLKGAQRGG